MTFLQIRDAVAGDCSACKKLKVFDKKETRKKDQKKVDLDNIENN